MVSATPDNARSTSIDTAEGWPVVSVVCGVRHAMRRNQGDATVDPWDGVAMRLPLGKLAARYTVVPEYGVYRPAAC